jgi:hypothetical protein
VIYRLDYNEAKKIDLFEIYTKLLNIFENCIHKNDILKVRIMCQEIARIQDFAPFTPELLGLSSLGKPNE